MVMTNQFDTFTETNIIIQAEDFDFDSGKFIDNPAPEAYLGVPDSVAEVDFHHTAVSGERYTYRAVGSPTEVTADYRLKVFSEAGNTDYNIGYFNNGEWANYTRTFPTNRYRVYGRFAGDGGFSVYLDKVVSGVGTTNQVTQRLGRFGHVGRDWQAWDWVPLTDEGLSAPVLVSLGGTNTLRLSTTGNANVNYLMLVPATGIAVTAKRSGNTIEMTIPTQPGAFYRVFYKEELLPENWTLLTTLMGDGSPKTVNDPLSADSKFYQVVSP
jgi:hypothetical protein